MAKKAKKVIIEVNIKTIVKVVAVLVAIFLVVYLRTVVLIFLVSFITMAALRPSVDFLVRKKVKKVLAVFIVVFLGMIVLGSLLFLVSIPLIRQLRVFIDHFPEMIQDVVQILREGIPSLQKYLTPERIDEFLKDYQLSIASQLEGVWTNLWETIKATFGLFGSLLTVVTTFTLSVYMLIERDNIVESLSLLLHGPARKRARALLARVENKVGAWLRGQIVLCLIVGLLTWVVLSLLGIKYAAALGVLAGLLEVVPVLGPILAAVPITITGFSVGVWPGVGSLAAVFFIQQVENALLVPLVMKRAVGLSPVVTLLAILIGSELFGIIGAVISVPVAGIVTVLAEEYFASSGIIINKGIGRGDSAQEIAKPEGSNK